jgi:hypothetical protein
MSTRLISYKELIPEGIKTAFFAVSYNAGPSRLDPGKGPVLLIKKDGNNG